MCNPLLSGDLTKYTELTSLGKASAARGLSACIDPLSSTQPNRIKRVHSCPSTLVSTLIRLQRLSHQHGPFLWQQCVCEDGFLFLETPSLKKKIYQSNETAIKTTNARLKASSQSLITSLLLSSPSGDFSFMNTQWTHQLACKNDKS